MIHHLTRRSFLSRSTAVGVTASILAPASVQAAEEEKSLFTYCLNTGTIAGHKLTIEQQIELVGHAGYDGIEPWIRDIEAFVQRGGNLNDLRMQIADAGLTVDSAIGFARWIADDENQRKAGLEQAKRDMDLVRQIGGSRIAAPPAGVGKGARPDLIQIAERYGALLTVGAEIGVIPQVEVWGSSSVLSRLGEAVCVAIESDHPDACVLLDVYHLYKGGSPFSGLKLLAGNSMHCFHINDYPANPPRETIGDRDRVYPGDGIAPLDQILQTLLEIGFSGVLSLELFNREYWAHDATKVVRTGLEKMKEAVARAIR